ncbi:longiborneol synthase [Fusarium albosuccineum]|uniref:Longiborneol synthase n=1 Tax=Fusarium albosuccineum TaxID=1237068 RepID=A0A8H4KPX1_9HYPO|nr:longiborneol synthase [Fusarium albosuccineum]
MFGRCLPSNPIRLYSSGDETSDDLKSMVKHVCFQLLAHLDYPGAPHIDSWAAANLETHMKEGAEKLGLSLKPPMSKKGFQLGYAEGLLAHPGHPVELQAYIGLFTWLVVQYDDIVGRDNDMIDEARLFQQRFIRGEPQPTKLLEGIANMMRRAHDHFDSVLADLLQISVLKFLASNVLEQHDGFQRVKAHQMGRNFPDFYRDMSGMSIAFAIFCYPKVLYPEINNFLEAIPDMARFIDLCNDVLSFYKEELEDEKTNYIHNRADRTGKAVFYIDCKTWALVASILPHILN